jgi:hypothetical protein
MMSGCIRAFAKRALLVFFAGLLTGCSRAPSVDVMGSFFPGWLVCVIVGIVFAAVARLVLLRLRIKIALPILVYPSLAAIFTFVLWLLFYS